MLAPGRSIALFASVLAVSAGSAAAQTTEIFSFTGSIGSWTSPQAGEYRIVGIGAQGASGDSSSVGGRGAQIEGTFTLSAGQVFQILVGGAGTTDNFNGGGGGGTFFVTDLNNPLLIAGGGGGTRSDVDQNGTDGSVTEAAFNASGTFRFYIPTLKTTGIGQGGILSSSTYGSAGGGFFSAGASDSNCGGSLGPAGGGAWASGMEGGNNGSTLAPGGFGGGGSGDGCNGGGGGGGYSGGDGGRVAGGGGSFNAGSDQVAIAGVGLGDGSLTIIWLVFGPTTDEEIARLSAAAGTIGRIVVLDAREIARMRGQDSLATRDAMITYTHVVDPETAYSTVAMSTMNHASMIGNLYTWIDVTGFRAEDSDADRSYTGRGVQIGADIALSPDMVVGLSFGIQDLDASVGGFSQDGVLTFVQPYLAYRAGAWSGEASLIYGHGEYNQTSSGGGGEGETRLAALTFTGSYDKVMNSGAVLTPTLGFVHGVEEVEGLSGTLAGAGTETVRFTEVSLGAEISQSISGGEIFAGLHADWLDTSSGTTLVSNLLVDDGWTGRLALGVSTSLGNGLELDSSVELSGIGGDLQQIGGALRVAFRF